ncbi:MAG: hypothetical protein V9G19_19525 [Tetrasphaera sp.]
MDVVVAGGPDRRSALPVLAATPGRSGRGHTTDPGQARRHGPGPGQPGALQEPATSQLGRGEFGVGNARVARGSQVGRRMRVVCAERARVGVTLVMSATVLISVTARLSVIVRTTHR